MNLTLLVVLLCLYFSTYASGADHTPNAVKINSTPVAAHESKQEGESDSAGIRYIRPAHIIVQDRIRGERAGVLDIKLGDQLAKIAGVKQVNAELIDVITLEERWSVRVEGWEVRSSRMKSLDIQPGGHRLTEADKNCVLLDRHLAKSIGKKVGDTLTIFDKNNYRVAGIFNGSVDEDGRMVVLLKEMQASMHRDGKASVFTVAVEEPENRAEINRIVSDIQALRNDLQAIPLVQPPFVAISSEARGPILTYEIDTGRLGVNAAPTDMDKLRKAIDERLNSRKEKLARVRMLDGERIEVALLRQNDVERQRVERLLARPGRLDFRILASNHKDMAVIEQAQMDKSKRAIFDRSASILAWWVPVKTGEENNFADDKDIAQRTRKHDDHDIMEILVVADRYNVTFAYLLKAEASTDRNGNACLNFTLNDVGGQLFAGLTGDHLPDKSMNFGYRLGFILDGELYATPRIHSVISNKGVITGSFTNEQLLDLANIFNSGCLPVRLRLVQESKRGRS